MKRRAWAVFLGIAYIAVLVALLMTHVRLIAGTLERRMAMVEIILLALSVFLIPLLFSGVKKTEKHALKEEKQSVSEKASVHDYESFIRRVCADDLSEREKEVAWLIYRGFTNRQIAEELFIAESTVKKHVSHIFEKTGAGSRKELKEKWRKE